ncbi:dynamin family protein [Solwaraspora sp. WMMB762]|uniref:dynamin family protein n=1 Tax=Solwaraspora sp. WMMB762 TaxID=3404120 RepID=UPI003B94B336
MNESSLPEPADVTAQIELWLTRAGEITTQSDLVGPQERVGEIRLQLARGGFRAVVVGEFGRGKTTLVNEVLGRPLLPVATSLAQTVVVCAGTPESICVPGRDGYQRFALDSDALGRLRTTDLLDPPVRMTIEHPLLDSLEMELVDTPGGNDRRSGPTDLVRRTVAEADAVIMVVAANAPLSLDEMAMLTDQVVAGGAPHVLIAVSKLDLVDPQEHDRVLHRIRTKTAAVSSNIDVACLATPGSPDPAAAVREWLVTAAAPGHRRRARAAHAAVQLGRVLHTLADTAGEAARLRKLDVERRRAGLAQARSDLDKESMLFDEYRLELRRRHAAVLARFRAELDDGRTHLSDTLRHELRRASDPRIWWDRDMPRRLHRELTITAGEQDNRVRGEVISDLRWFETEILHRFGGHQIELVVDYATTSASPVAAQPINLPPLRLRKLAYRVGPSTVALAGALLVPGLGPIAMIGASIAGTLLTEIKLRMDVEEQRQVVEARLGTLVDRVVQEFADSVDTRLRQLYDHLVETTVEVRRSWYAERLSALETVQHDDDDGPDWSLVAERATRLANAVTAATRPDQLTGTAAQGGNK